jgi:hypothetical protein
MCFAELPDPDTPVTDSYAVGNFVVAVYESLWYIGQVEGEEPEEETAGFTLIKYMDRKGHNQFVWGVRDDIYKTKNSDILLQVDPPVPVVSDRIWGLPKDTLKKVEDLFKVVVYYTWESRLNVFFQSYQSLKLPHFLAVLVPYIC